jgi:hypothetical protein
MLPPNQAPIRDRQLTCRSYSGKRSRQTLRRSREQVSPVCGVNQNHAIVDSGIDVAFYDSRRRMPGFAFALKNDRRVGCVLFREVLGKVFSNP